MLKIGVHRFLYIFNTYNSDILIIIIFANFDIIYNIGIH